MVTTNVWLSVSVLCIVNTSRQEATFGNWIKGPIHQYSLPHIKELLPPFLFSTYTNEVWKDQILWQVFHFLSH